MSDLTALYTARTAASARTASLVRAAHAARATYERTPLYLIEAGRAHTRWMVAESHVEGAIRAEKDLDGQIFEALNPELA